jgi:hypothetical protein
VRSKRATLSTLESPEYENGNPRPGDKVPANFPGTGADKRSPCRLALDSLGKLRIRCTLSGIPANAALVHLKKALHSFRMTSLSTALSLTIRQERLKTTGNDFSPRNAMFSNHSSSSFACCMGGKKRSKELKAIPLLSALAAHQHCHSLRPKTPPG